LQEEVEYQNTFPFICVSAYFTGKMSYEYITPVRMGAQAFDLITQMIN